MGIFGSLTKSIKLKNLESKLAPQNLSAREMLESHDTQKKSVLFEEFLDLCVSDPGVLKVMDAYKLSREDLTIIYKELENILGYRWEKGHCCALSSIAYLEPLYYYLSAKEMSESKAEIEYQLVSYWRGLTSQGQLIKYCYTVNPLQ